MNVRCFASANDCLKQLHPGECDLLITDVKMPEMDGVELLTRARCITPWLPVLVITGYGDIPTAVRAMKAGASDFIEKPLDREGFLSMVQAILARDVSTGRLFDIGLTPTEIKVLRFILEGKNGREIANLLHRHVRTIEYHRSNLYYKLGVNNLLDLIRRAAEMGLLDLPQNAG
jgi:two-component system response regulator FixJ